MPPPGTGWQNAFGDSASAKPAGIAETAARIAEARTATVSPAGGIGQNTAMTISPNALKTCVLLLLCCLSALMRPAVAREQLNATVEQYLLTQTRGLPGKVSVSDGQIDPRVQLSPCSAYDPFLPPGTQLWGKATIGVRCLGPSSWTIYLPVQIRVIGNYVVTARALNPGQPLANEDMAVQNGDLTMLPTGILTDREQGVGKTLRSALAGGQPLRSDMLVAPFVVQQGQDVRLVTRGRGFSATNEGKALNNASDGQVARARTANGQTVSGIARPGGIIEVTP
jgi:flagella basal body P-ring formation protein FlgA